MLFIAKLRSPPPPKKNQVSGQPICICLIKIQRKFFSPEEIRNSFHHVLKLHYNVYSLGHRETKELDFVLGMMSIR